MTDNMKLLSILKNTDVSLDLDKEARQKIEQIWKQIPGADPAESVNVSEQETNEAYRNVKSRIDSGDTEVPKNSGFYIKYAAAAIFLVCTVGLTYILYPITVNAPHGDTQTVLLPDESTVQLNSGSEITYSRLFGIWNREVSLQGEALFDVQSNGTTFQVTTDNASIKVLGTRFNVRYWPSDGDNRTSVFLSEGRITLESLLTDADPVILKAGELSWISEEQQNPAQPVTIDKEKAIDWQYNNITFENQPLSAVFGELERRFDITINGHPNIMNEKITIYLSDIEDAESALKDICRAKGLTYKKQNEKFLVYRN